MYELKLSETEVNVILRHLGEGKYREVFQTVASLQRQLDRQIRARKKKDSKDDKL